MSLTYPRIDPHLDALRAATHRSWERNSGVFHVLAETDQRGSLGAFECETVSRCGVVMTVRDYDTIPAELAPSGQLCARRGCVEHWDGDV